MIRFTTKTLFTLPLLSVLIGIVPNDDTTEAAHRKLSFLVGDWETQSIWPESGERASGLLTYEWVLGGSWLKVTFRGHHPSRPVWEAHGMIRYLPEKGHYESLIFAGPEEPLRLRGFWLNEGTLRFETETDGVKSGIDYMPRGYGVYQENWRMPSGGSHTILLKTTYAKRSGP